jgi:outer membrane protein
VLVRLLRVIAVAAMLVLAAAPVALAQAPAKPAEPVQPAPAPPPLFPAEAKFAFLNFQRVASDSVSGKLATRVLDELRKKKVSEIEIQNKALQALASKRDSGALNGTALTQVGKDIDKLQREIQFTQQSAQAEVQQLETELMTDFEKRVTPVVAAIAREKGLHAVFAADSAIALYVHPAIDISSEVIKRLDAQPKQ